MSTNITLKRSAVPGKVPTTTNLSLGELALNTYDGRIFLKKNVGGVEDVIAFYGASVNDDTVTVNSFTGDGATTAYTLTRIPQSTQYVSVYINGVLQFVTDYTLNVNVLNFSVAPASGDLIEIRVYNTIPSTVSLRDYQSYVFSVTNAASISGSDTFGNPLVYDIGKVEVYLNGARLVNNYDYVANNETTVSFTSNVTGTVEVVSLSRASFRSDLVSNTNTLSTNTASQLVDSFDSTVYRTAKYIVQMSTSTEFHSTEVLLMHDGTNVYITEYATLYSNTSLGTINATLTSGYVQLLVTPINTNTKINTTKILVSV